MSRATLFTLTCTCGETNSTWTRWRYDQLICFEQNYKLFDQIYSGDHHCTADCARDGLPSSQGDHSQGDDDDDDDGDHRNNHKLKIWYYHYKLKLLSLWD